MAALARIELIELSGEVCVRLVGDDEMRAMHARHLKLDSTTDILTFDLGSDGAAGLLDADLVLCVDEAARQAAARGVDLEHELALYIVHGVLHCLGHNDHDDAGYARMHALEDRVLEAIGLPPVFAAPRRPAADRGEARAGREGGAC